MRSERGRSRNFPYLLPDSGYPVGRSFCCEGYGSVRYHKASELRTLFASLRHLPGRNRRPLAFNFCGVLADYKEFATGPKAT